MSSFSVDPQKQGISNKIFNADSFSIFTSIGLHLLILGGLLPSLWQFSPDSQAKDRQRTVNVIELNPIEQSRLPNLSPTPEVPAVSNIPSLDSSAIPNLSSLNPVNPPAVPSLPSLPSLPPLPPISSIPSYPPSVGVYSPPIPSVRIPRTLQNFPPAPTYLPPAPTNNPNLEVAKPRQITRPPFDPFKDTLDLESLRRAPINASLEEQLRNQQQREVPPQTTTSVPQNPPIATLPNQAAIAAQRRRRLLNDVLEGSASLQPDASNTTTEEVRKNYQTWIEKAPKGQFSILKVAGVYPKTACSRKIEGTSVYGVSVNPQGILTGTPYLIKSAGYPLLNQRAFQTVRGMNFQNGSGQMTTYQVHVNYKYDPSICPAGQQPVEPIPPVETRVTPPQTPVLEPSKPPIAPKPQNQSPNPVTAPQPPANPKPENVRVEPPIPAKPEVVPPTPTQPPENNLINTPSGNPKPENLIPQTPVNPPESKKTEPQPVIVPPVAPAKPEPSVEPPAPPATQKPEVNPPSPPTSKKPESPLAESGQPNQ